MKCFHGFRFTGGWVLVAVRPFSLAGASGGCPLVGVSRLLTAEPSLVEGRLSGPGPVAVAHGRFTVFSRVFRSSGR